MKRKPLKSEATPAPKVETAPKAPLKAETKRKPKKKGAGPRPEPETVRGLALSNVDEASLSAYLAEVRVKVPAGASKTDLVEHYMDHTAAVVEKLGDEPYGECERCDAPCPPERPVCPACGKPHEDGEPAPVAAPPPHLVSGPRGPEMQAPTATLERREDNLDAAVSRIHTLLAEQCKSEWDTGRELRGIKDAQSWKTRVGAGGKPVHRSFERFVEAELNLSAHKAGDLIAVADNFSAVEVVCLGVTKLKLVLRAPADARPKLLEDAKNLSKRQLESVVQDRFPGRGRTADAQDDVREAARKRATDAAAEAARKRREQADSGEAVTVVFQLGQRTLPLDKNGEGRDEEVNSVRTTYTVKVNNHGRPVALTIHHQRITDAAKAKAAE